MGKFELLTKTFFFPLLLFPFSKLSHSSSPNLEHPYHSASATLASL